MRKSHLFVWLLIPPILIALHAGPGRTWMMHDRAADLTRSADRLAIAGNWEESALTYLSALTALPEQAVEQRRPLAVALGRSLVMSGNILEGQEVLEATLNELEGAGLEHSADAQAARFELATSSYYAAWIMRLEGAVADEWLGEAERARQHFRLLSEQTAADNVADDEGLSDMYQRNLEATIALEQMDLSELLARPRPKNCPNCKQGLCQSKRKQRSDQCQGQGDKESERKSDENAHDKIKKNNGAGLHSGNRPGS